MEVFRLLQQRLAYGSGRQASRLRNARQNSWKTLKGWNTQQTASLHRQSYAYRVSNFLGQTKWLGRSRNVRWQSSKPTFNPTENLGSPEPQSLSARMRKLSREYGWSALGVYLGLSALDFPFCFLAVRLLGTDRIGHWEHVVIETFWKGVESVYPEGRSVMNKAAATMHQTTSEEDAEREGTGWGVEEAEARNKSDSASECSGGLGKAGKTNLERCRYLDTTRTCLRHSQVLHLHSGTPHGGYHAEGGQDIERMGMEHRQEEAQVIDDCRHDKGFASKLAVNRHCTAFVTIWKPHFDTSTQPLMARMCCRAGIIACDHRWQADDMHGQQSRLMALSIRYTVGSLSGK